MSKLVKLGPTQETLLYPLLARARETEKRDGVLHDPKAVEIIKALDYDFSKWDKPEVLYYAIARTMIFEQYIEQFLEKHPTGTVVELGCGLNTRYERLDNGKATWVDLDFPDVIELRKQFFAEHPRRKMIAANAADKSWLEVVKSTKGPWCFPSESVLVYLDHSLVQQTFTQIADTFPQAWFVVDTYPAGFVRKQNENEMLKHVPEEARLKWACEDLKQIELWTDGKFKLRTSRNFYDAPSKITQKAPPTWLDLDKIAGGSVTGYRMSVFVTEGS